MERGSREEENWERLAEENQRGLIVNVKNSTDLKFVLVFGLNHSGTWFF